MILCIGPTPASQRVMVFQKLATDEVNRAAQTLDGAAGKGINVAKVLKALGEEPIYAGFLGGDRGEELRSCLETMGIPVECEQVEPPTRQCITVIDRQAGTVTELVEESRPIQAQHYDSLFERLLGRGAAAGNRCKAAIMSGTITPAGPADFYQRCTRLAHDLGALAIVDAKGEPLQRALEASPDLVKPNRNELEATLGNVLPDERAVLNGMQRLRERGAAMVVITAGAAPALAFDGRYCWRIKSPEARAVNPIGSGDAFTAGVACRLVRGDEIGEACRWGAAAGTANALTLMAGEVVPGEVERLAKLVQVERVML